MVNQQLKNRALHRGKIIRGQLDGLLRAIDREAYCTMLLHQSRAIQQSLKSLDRLLLENHLRTHVKEQMRKPSQVERAIRELVAALTATDQ